MAKCRCFASREADNEAEAPFFGFCEISGVEMPVDRPSVGQGTFKLTSVSRVLLSVAF